MFMTSTPPKYLPSTNEFTPNIIDLAFCLNAVSSSRSDLEFKEKLRQQYFSSHAATRKDPQDRKEQQMKLAGNVLIGMRNYQIVQPDDIVLSDVGNKLLQSNFVQIKEVLARHLIDTLCGNEILHAMDSLAKRKISKRDKKHLAQELTVLGLKTKKGMAIPVTTTDHTKFATWLNWCGILNENDEVVEANYQEFIGKPSGLVSKIWFLKDDQFLFLKFVWETFKKSGKIQLKVKEIIQQSEKSLGKYISRPDQVAASILKPLDEFGFIKINRTSEGRGGNSGSIELTDATQTLTWKDFDFSDEPVSVVKNVDKSLTQIFSELESNDTGIKGIALEDLAIHLGSVLGLRFLSFREQSAATGGTEVDVIFEHVGNSYAKWIVQCKNTPKNLVHVSTIAKEVGNAVVTQANVVFIITTGRFSIPAKQFAEKTILTSNLQVLLLDGDDLKEYKDNGDSFLIRKVNAKNEEIAILRGQQ
jgi:hypothetical protein